MKIDNNVKGLTTGAMPDETARSGKQRVTSETSPADTNVRISSLSSHLQAIEQGFADTPVVDAARVAELKTAISNGHFKVDAEKVADRLLTTVREMIHAHKA